MVRVNGVMLVAAAALSFGTPSIGQVPAPEERPTRNEWALLPAYCPDTQGLGKYGRNSPNAPKWVAMMGLTFWALHHYCFGILKFHRAQRPEYPPVIRSGLLTSAIGEFEFVIRDMPQDYVLAPEIYTYVGRTYLLKEDPKDADVAFTKARTLKPDYWPAYSWWASYLAQHGKSEEARAIVAQGLEHAPNSRTLRLLRQDLSDGKTTERDQAER